MSQKVRESLYELIQSLTKSEKRYFKVHASRHTIGDENGYVRLFDYLEKLHLYDEEKVFSDFEGEAFLNRFSITKKRLYDQILASLDAFHAATSVDAQLYRMLHAADILFSKTLYDQCERELRSAEKLARKYDRQAILLEISRKQKRNLENQGYKEFSHEQLLDLHQRDIQHLKQIEIFDQLWFIKSELFMTLNKKGKARNPEEREKYDRIIQQLPEETFSEYIGFENRYLIAHTKSAYHFALGEMPESMIHLKTLLALLQENPHLLEEHLSAYFSTLTNLIFVSEKLGRDEESLHYLKLLKRIPIDNDLSTKEDLRIKLFASTLSIELELLTKRGDLTHAREQLTFIEEGLDCYGDKISVARRSFIRLKLAVVCLGLNEWAHARRLLSKLLNDPEIGMHEIHLAKAHLLNLLLDIETGNTELFGYAQKNWQRFLKVNERYGEIEQVISHGLGKISRASNGIDRKERWQDLHEKLALLSEKESSFDFIDLKTWATSRWTDQPYEAVLRAQWEAKKYGATTRENEISA